MIGDGSISVGCKELMQRQTHLPAQWTQFQQQLLPLHALQKLLIVDDGELFLQLEDTLGICLNNELLGLPEWLQHQLLAVGGIFGRQVTRLASKDIATQQTYFGRLGHEIDYIQ